MNAMSNVAELRRNYTRAGLKETDADPNPFMQFQTWFDQALSADLPEPNAMTLATITPEGKPSARIVLLKGFDETGFVFYTNYGSQKGQHLANNPWASLVFWWVELERQVRIDGYVEKVSDEESEAYFTSRPFGSRLGAWASPQSEVIASRAVLEEKLVQLETQYDEMETVPKPPNWGGYRLMPTEIEFWQGRPNRLHDRLRYRQQEDKTWLRERLAP
ncbi:MAG: pyridoxamine 5'-phosphate oxidase [Halothece sp. Uz-M2-17]|nr:pyridoxamine 5'-phosphate oxidase [Halothece sp. Uz-M2-17]